MFLELLRELVQGASFLGDSLPRKCFLYSKYLCGALSDLSSLCPLPWEDDEGCSEGGQAGMGQPAQEPMIQAYPGITAMRWGPPRPLPALQSHPTWPFQAAP